MWSAILGSALTFGLVVYMQGPLVALALTALGSAVLLLAVRSAPRKMRHAVNISRPLEVLEGGGGSEVFFPPLTNRTAS